MTVKLGRGAPPGRLPAMTARDNSARLAARKPTKRQSTTHKGGTRHGDRCTSAAGGVLRRTAKRSAAFPDISTMAEVGPGGEPREQYANFIRSEVAKWGKVAREPGITVN